MGWKVLKGLLPFPRTSMLCRIWTEVISSGWTIKSTDCGGFGFRLREGLSWEHGRLQLQWWSLPRAKWGIGLLENLLLIREIRWGRGASLLEAPWFTCLTGLEVEALFMLSDVWPLTKGVAFDCFGRGLSKDFPFDLDLCLLMMRLCHS